MNTEILVAVVAGVFSVIAVLVSRSWENKKTRKEHLKAKKIPIYESVIEFVFRTIAGTGQPEDDESFIDITKQLMTWGSYDILNEFMRFHRRVAKLDPQGILDSASGLLTAIRKDLDHKDIKYEYMKMLVNLALIEEIRNLPEIESDNARDDTQGVERQV